MALASINTRLSYKTAGMDWNSQSRKTMKTLIQRDRASLHRDL